MSDDDRNMPVRCGPEDDPPEWDNGNWNRPAGCICHTVEVDKDSDGSTKETVAVVHDRDCPIPSHAANARRGDP